MTVERVSLELERDGRRLRHPSPPPLSTTRPARDGRLYLCSFCSRRCPPHECRRARERECAGVIVSPPVRGGGAMLSSVSLSSRWRSSPASDTQCARAERQRPWLAKMLGPSRPVDRSRVGCDGGGNGRDGEDRGREELVHLAPTARVRPRVSSHGGRAFARAHTDGLYIYLTLDRSTASTVERPDAKTRRYDRQLR